MNATGIFLLYALDERERDRRLELQRQLRDSEASRTELEGRRARRERSRMFDLPVLAWLFGPLGQP